MRIYVTFYFLKVNSQNATAYLTQLSKVNGLTWSHKAFIELKV